jgi:hypothetical protein
MDPAGAAAQALRRARFRDGALLRCERKNFRTNYFELLNCGVFAASEVAARLGAEKTEGRTAGSPRGSARSGLRGAPWARDAGWPRPSPPRRAVVPEPGRPGRRARPWSRRGPGARARWPCGALRGWGVAGRDRRSCAARDARGASSASRAPRGEGRGRWRWPGAAAWGRPRTAPAPVGVGRARSRPARGRARRRGRRVRARRPWPEKAKRRRATVASGGGGAGLGPERDGVR